jgi:hypothetical protein
MVNLVWTIRRWSGSWECHPSGGSEISLKERLTQRHVEKGERSVENSCGDADLAKVSLTTVWVEDHVVSHARQRR